MTKEIISVSLVFNAGAWTGLSTALPSQILNICARRFPCCSRQLLQGPKWSHSEEIVSKIQTETPRSPCEENDCLHLLSSRSFMENPGNRSLASEGLMVFRACHP